MEQNALIFGANCVNKNAFHKNTIVYKTSSN